MNTTLLLDLFTNSIMACQISASLYPEDMNVKWSVTGYSFLYKFLMRDIRVRDDPTVCIVEFLTQLFSKRDDFLT